MGNTTVVDKLRKLIAHEQSARKIGSLEEAEAFAARISQMLAKHRLEMSDVDVQAEMKAGEPIGQTSVDPKEAGAKAKTGYAVDWQVVIANGVCAAAGCGLMWNTGTGSAIFVGKESARETAKALYLYMVKLAVDMAWKSGQKEKPRLIRQCVATWGEGCFGHQSQVMKEWRESFCSGFGMSVGMRLVQTAKQEEQQAEKAQTHTSALVLVRKDAEEVKHYISQTANGKGANTKNPFRRTDHSAFDQGHAAGSKVALTSNTLRR